MSQEAPHVMEIDSGESISPDTSASQPATAAQLALPGAVDSTTQPPADVPTHSVTEGDETTQLRTYVPSNMEEEILRILRWPAWAYYEILEIEENATLEEIKKAYRNKSLLTHPNRNKDRSSTEVCQSKRSNRRNTGGTKTRF
jgi:hypothetical protein